ncbi:hypothetical protein CKO25_19095 [Thiocapsa imhoffii]|uniref:DUF1887 family protein n=1 Tax=Thiocapsa imhoffii TaxID=382777 RepID=A0A9X0WLG6_9GAMM|nr:hypothetical protein [Thiocapsa imhoffii]MBK1646706.1 hypothetical protein [Thiocapsa imhoffii]
MPQASLFVALSTQQNIANILPILELGKPGDRVLWIESETARKNNWSQGACVVLRRYGISDIETLPVDDDPVSIQQILTEHPALQTTDFTIKLVANGGTKLQMLATSKALNGHISELLYNSDRVCLLERYRYHRDRQEPVEAIPYQGRGVDLLDMLTCNNKKILGEAEQIWPSDSPELPLYGKDIDYTSKRHQRIWEWEKSRPSCPEPAFSYEEAVRISPEKRQALTKIVLDCCGLKKIQNEDHYLKKIYDAAHRLDADAWKKQPKRASDEEAPDVGRDLEDAVSVRVIRWINQNPNFAKMIQSIWRNVKITPSYNNKIEAELDVALLLKNGRLLHLECKAFDAPLKDMNSRYSVLQRSSSQIAKMAICIPFFEPLSDLEWHKEISENANKINEWDHFDLIEFTFPEQLGTKGLTFEESLTKWVKPFLFAD